MCKIFFYLMLLVSIKQINSLEIPILSSLQDLIKFAGEVKEIFSNGINFKESSINDKNNPANSAIQAVNSILDLNEITRARIDFDHISLYVDSAYDSFLKFAENLTIHDESTVLEFIESVTSDGQGHLPTVMNTFCKTVVVKSPRRKTYWETSTLRNLYEGDCDTSKTIQTELFQSYVHILTFEVKLLVAAEGANSFKESIANGDSPNYDKPEEDFVTRITKYLKGLKDILYTASGAIFRCDALKHVLGESYIEFRGLFDDYPVNEAIRTLSLRPQLSNIDENKVVVNVRFESSDKMIQVQIQEAPLQPNGEVNNKEAKWISLDRVIYNFESNEGGFSLADSMDNEALEKDVDFVFVTQEDNTMNIDQISGGPGYVLTGVKFSRQDSGSIELEIRVTPYDYSTGQLNTEENQSMWINAATQPAIPEMYKKERKDLGIGRANYIDFPLFHHICDRHPNQFVRFVKSSPSSDDRQTIIPVLDSRSAGLKEKVLLNGLGIIYQRSIDHGGILAFELLTISLAEGLNFETADEQ